MNKVVLQFWVDSERGKEIRPSGCSLHIDLDSKNKYVESIYEGRISTIIPNEYDKINGDSIDAFISDVMYSKVKLKGSVRIFEHELNNLMSMAEIIIRDGR